MAGQSGEADAAGAAGAGAAGTGMGGAGAAGTGVGGEAGGGGTSPDAPLEDVSAVADVEPVIDLPPPDVGQNGDVKTQASDGGVADASAIDTSPASGLLGYWKLDETSGLVATDSSGKGNHGTLENLSATAAWVAGHTGGGIEFPAIRGGQGIRVPITPALDGIRAFTIAMWCMPKRRTGNYLWSLISREHATDAAEIFNLAIDADEFIIFFSGSELRVRDVVVTNKWNHVAATYDGQAARLFVNGLEVAANTNLPSRLASGTTPLYIGTNKNEFPFVPLNDESFDGTLDEVVIYPYALTAANIKALNDGVSPFSF